MDLNSSEALSSYLDNKVVMITGASGFVGRSLLRSLKNLKRTVNFKVHVICQYRTFSKCDEFVAIDEHIVAEIGSHFQTIKHPDIIFHCATPASAVMNIEEPRRMFELNVQAMDWILDNPVLTKNSPIIVFMSSGAVYGSQPDHLSHIPETWTGGLNTFSSGIAYAEGKRVAEFLLSEAARTGKVQQSICRLFAFSGVGIPFDRHFAIGNFVKDVVDNQKITVRSDGSSIRSYLDSDDMARWLLTASTKPRNDFPYHIGSEHALSIGELAETTSKVIGTLTGKSIPVEILGTNSPIDGFKRYVPANRLTRAALGVEELITLEQSIVKMFHAYREGSH